MSTTTDHAVSKPSARRGVTATDAQGHIHTFHMPARVRASSGDVWRSKIARHLEANGWTVAK